MLIILQPNDFSWARVTGPSALLRGLTYASVVSALSANWLCCGLYGLGWSHLHFWQRIHCKVGWRRCMDCGSLIIHLAQASSHCCHLVSRAAREGKPQCTGTFQFSACFTLAMVPWHKASSVPRPRTMWEACTYHSCCCNSLLPQWLMKQPCSSVEKQWTIDKPDSRVLVSQKRFLLFFRKS